MEEGWWGWNIAVLSRMYAHSLFGYETNDKNVIMIFPGFVNHNANMEYTCGIRVGAKRDSP